MGQEYNCKNNNKIGTLLMVMVQGMASQRILFMLGIGEKGN